MPLNGKEKTFCVYDYARKKSNKTVQRACVIEFVKNAPTASRSGHVTKNSKWKAVCAGRNDLDNHQYPKRGLSELG